MPRTEPKHRTLLNVQDFFFLQGLVKKQQRQRRKHGTFHQQRVSIKALQTLKKDHIYYCQREKSYYPQSIDPSANKPLKKRIINGKQ
ncbi:hypothetical protein [Lewinella sp. LCG006]|uniref:hypothetical protein n=1 Tax=Lewinella sp. LCG006 TaxID=3231911 RepID=UPI00346144BF